MKCYKCGRIHDFPYCPWCGCEYKSFPSEPIYIEKDAEIIGEIPQVDKLAYQLMNKRLDEIEDKVEELPRIFTKLMTEAFDEGWKRGKKK